jgi:hypothetical protein
MQQVSSTNRGYAADCIQLAAGLTQAKARRCWDGGGGHACFCRVYVKTEASRALVRGMPASAPSQQALDAMLLIFPATLTSVFRFISTVTILQHSIRLSAD